MDKLMVTNSEKEEHHPKIKIDTKNDGFNNVSAFK